MQRQLTLCGVGKRILRGIIPNVGAIPSEPPKLNVVDMSAASSFENKYKLVFGAIETSHATIAFIPNAKVLHFAVEVGGGAQQFFDVAPIDTDKME